MRHREAAATRDRKVTLGVIGYGYWGPNLARNFLALKRAKLKYVCEADPLKMEQAGRDCPGAVLEADYRALLSDPDVEAVVIASPAATHLELAMRALDSGKHVFVEKPMSLEVEGGRRLLRFARERGLVLMVGHVFIYHPAVQYMKRFIDSGELGDVFYAYSQRLNLGRLRKDENCLWSLAPHDVSIMLYLMGTEPESVVCRGSSYLQDGLEDVVFFTMYFPGGQTGNVHVSWLDPRKVRLFTIVGSEKMLVFDDMSPEAKVRLYDRRVYPATPDEIMGYGDELRIHFGEETVPPLRMEEPLRRECSAFLDAVRDGVAPLTGGDQGLAVIRVLDAAGRSMSAGGEPVPVGGD